MGRTKVAKTQPDSDACLERLGNHVQRRERRHGGEVRSIDSIIEELASASASRSAHVTSLELPPQLPANLISENSYFKIKLLF